MLFIFRALVPRVGAPSSATNGGNLVIGQRPILFYNMERRVYQR